MIATKPTFQIRQLGETLGEKVKEQLAVHANPTLVRNFVQEKVGVYMKPHNIDNLKQSVNGMILVKF